MLYNKNCRSNPAQEKGNSENGDKKPGGYVHPPFYGRRWSRMEIAYIISMTVIAVVAILVKNRDMKK